MWLIWLGLGGFFWDWGVDRLLGGTPSAAAKDLAQDHNVWVGLGMTGNGTGNRRSPGGITNKEAKAGITASPE